MRFKTKFFGVALALCSVASCALTLGPVQGTPLIGRQLNLSVAVQTQSESSAGTLCPQVEVFYADNKLDPRQVKVTTEPTDRSDGVTLRIFSESPVNEPVVTLQLRAGCESEVSRRYVLLPDVPSESSVPTEVLAQLPQLAIDGSQHRSLPAPPGAPASASASTSASASAIKIPSDSSQGKPTSRVLDKPASTRSTAARSPNRAPAAAKVAPKSQEPGTGSSRLTLDPLEILVERVRTLESATQPEQLDELARTSQNVLRLQADIKTLLDQATMNASNMGALQERLRKAEETRVADALVYLLAAVALVCAVGIVVFWRRSENLMRALAEKPSTPFAEIAQHHQQAPEPQPQAQPQPQADAIPPVAPKALLVNEDWLEIDEKGLRDFIHPLPTEPAPLETIPDPGPPPHVPEPDPSSLDFHSNDVLALIDQARLLVQLGKIDDATNVLESRIRKKETDSPLVFLEILRIANVCNRKADFRRFSEKFQRVFNVTVPEFALFRAEGRTLDAYPGLQQHIEKLWPNPEVLAVIESCIVRSAWGNNSEPFDLAAFKELVQLHGLALNASLSPEDSAMQEFPKQNFDSTMIDFEV